MFNPCIGCHKNYTKSTSSQKCVTDCEYSNVLNILSKIFLESDGCLYCIHGKCGDSARSGWCDSDNCNNYENYELDMSKVIDEYDIH